MQRIEKHRWASVLNIAERKSWLTREDFAACKRINNFEVVLWKLLDTELISLREYLFTKSLSESSDKRATVFHVLERCYHDSEDIISEILEETGNSHLNFLLKRAKNRRNSHASV